MYWKQKALIQKIIHYLPFSEEIHYRMQRHFGGLKDIQGECASKVDDWSIMMKHLKSEGLSLVNKDVVEIGTGWFPLFPICLYLIGVQKVITFDLNRHMKTYLTQTCINYIGKNLDLIGKHCENSVNYEQRYKDFVRNYLKSFDITESSKGVILYNAPADVTDSRCTKSSIDLVFSNTVLEHVPKETIDRMMIEAKRILKPGAYMFHSVNCGDHYAYTDNMISQLNYLQYSDSEWCKWNNKFSYQNRMRAKEFTELAKKNSFEIIVDNSKPTEQRYKELSKLKKIGEQFKAFSNEELCITCIDFLSKKPG